MGWRGKLYGELKEMTLKAERRVRQELIGLLQGWRRMARDDLEVRVARIQFLATQTHILQDEWDVVDAMRRRITKLQKESYTPGWISPGKLAEEA